MKPSAVASRIVSAIEALVPAVMAHDADRFRGLVAEDPAQPVDRCFSVSLSLPVRGPDLLDPTEHLVRGAVAVAYVDGPDAMSRVLDDAAQLVETLSELADGDDLLSLRPDEGSVSDGPVQGTLLAVIPFVANYRYS